MSPDDLHRIQGADNAKSKQFSESALRQCYCQCDLSRFK
ncbi:hypothetical protein [Pseudomonas sp. F01002]|nr:hypothetical protein [Pseudomonas sp. F01002]